ncbi:MAG: hypothetical protein A2Z30_05315 [Chloroflexi bacterium RBG_16_64_43]|nr:MAG: hypothetical protein A2Z30_05315 [Chloroflexi bacterium RBG_16_64_43]
MGAVNLKKNLVNQMPTMKQIGAWVRQAKRLPRIVRYMQAAKKGHRLQTFTPNPSPSELGCQRGIVERGERSGFQVGGGPKAPRRLGILHPLCARLRKER